MSMDPPGHIPGVHIPGTTAPIGAIVNQQAGTANAAKRAEEDARKRRSALLLLLG